jgi:hypothetical protein
MSDPAAPEPSARPCFFFQRPAGASTTISAAAYCGGALDASLWTVAAPR